ncbi:unnamed protein product [Linum trigynum]|uniref:Aminotransferase-like plant mobile domain-containing protein n=1 Tax=Linum trigynum TaxID=586398 RepID=A0AAV2E9L0_9ROSI
MLDMFLEELNIECNRSRNVEVLDLKEAACGGPDDAPKRRPPVAAAVKQFLLLALGSMLIPKMSRLCDLDYAEYLVGRVEDIATFNWSGFVARNLKGFATKTIPTCSYWFEPRVDKVCCNIPKEAEKYLLGPMLFSREEVKSRFRPERVRRDLEFGSSSSASTTEWWKDVDLETLDDDELKALESMTEKMMDVWESRRDSVWRIVILRHQGTK